MLIMLVIDILVCPPEILLVHYDAASIRPPKYLNYFSQEIILCHFTNSAKLQCVLYDSINNI